MGGTQHAAECTQRFLQVWGPVECVAGIFPHMPECDCVPEHVLFLHACLLLERCVSTACSCIWCARVCAAGYIHHGFVQSHKILAPTLYC